MTAPFDFASPRYIAFGEGSLSRLSEIAAPYPSPALLVVGGGSLKKSGALDTILALLKKAGKDAVIFSGVEADPSIQTVDRGTALCRKYGCRFVVGVGGGSVIDCAKAISGMAAGEGSVRDYLEGKKAIERTALPSIAVATTAGTGAEATRNAVITNREQGYKRSLRHRFLVPEAAIVDPELTLALPPALTASCGLDALAQLIEPFVSLKANPIADALALRGMESVGRCLARAVRDGNDREARAGMSLSSLLSGMALANAGLGLAHALSHPLGARFGVPHGVACAILLPRVMEFNLPAAPERLARAAAALGVKTAGRNAEEDARRGVEWVSSLTREIGIPERLSPWGVKEADLAGLAQESQGSSRSGNPRSASDEECVALLRLVL
jgi:alcohol dehydrogenase class IV